MASGSIYRKMKYRLKVKRLTSSLVSLFGADKTNVTRLNHRDEYYKNYYFNQKLCEGIEIVAAIERISKKQAADLLMRAGFSSYMGGKVTEYIETEKEARKLNQKIKMTRFITIMRALARAKGRDVSKFV
jgi:hypothetical protein